MNASVMCDRACSMLSSNGRSSVPREPLNVDEAVSNKAGSASRLSNTKHSGRRDPGNAKLSHHYPLVRAKQQTATMMSLTFIRVGETMGGWMKSDISILERT